MPSHEKRLSVRAVFFHNRTRNPKPEKVSEANEGFGGVRTRARVYSEHAGAEKHEVRYPSAPAI